METWQGLPPLELVPWPSASWAFFRQKTVIFDPLLSGKPCLAFHQSRSSVGLLSVPAKNVDILPRISARPGQDRESTGQGDQ